MQVPLKFNRFSVKVFFLKKIISQYKVFENVAAYRRFRVSNTIDEISLRVCKLDFGPTQLHENP